MERIDMSKIEVSDLTGLWPVPAKETLPANGRRGHERMMMTDRPILFSAPMIRALLDGRKTQTRRVLKEQPPEGAKFFAWDLGPAGAFASFIKPDVRGNADLYPSRLPAWRGDQLWVREAFCPRLGWPAPVAKPHYRADDDRPEWRSLWKPSIHMPRWASRLTLIVADVRVQRLQDISEADARAEGVNPDAWVQPDGTDTPSYVSAFQTLWNSLHGPDAWAANPWVVALTFTVHPRNIDQIEATK
jgi:hypothetical protein